MAVVSINGGHSIGLIGLNHNMYIAQEKASNHIVVVSCRVCLSTLLNLLFHILTLPPINTNQCIQDGGLFVRQTEVDMLLMML
jgi:hypothetical protein